MNEVVHQCPLDGSNIMPCCGRTVYEVPPSDCIASLRYETLGGVKPNCQGEQVPYTPTTEEVRQLAPLTDEEFDLWLAEVKAEAVIELVARIEAAVILLGDDDITPTGRRMISKVLNPYRQGETE